MTTYLQPSLWFVALRSAVFFCILVTFSVLYYVVVIVPCLCVSPHLRHTITNGWSHCATFLLRVICGVRLSVHGLEHLAANTAAFFFVRHESALETLVLKTIVPSAVFVLKQELLAIPIIGTGLRFNQSIAIDRDKGKEALRHMQKHVSERLRTGYSVIVFPEGTRTPHHAPGVIKKGSCLLAKGSRMDTHLISHNAGLLWKKHSWLVHSGVVDIQISPAYDFYGQRTTDIAQQIGDFFAQQVRMSADDA